MHRDEGGGCICESNERQGLALYDLEVIVPVYNVEKYVAECVNSVLGQDTRYSFHVIVVNDGSTDGSREVLKQYEDNERVTIIDQDNKGFSGARNTGVRNANGRYLMFVDSDDRLAEGAIEKLMDKAIDGDYDVVSGGHVRFNGDGILDRQMPQEGKLSGFLWGKVYKAKIWQALQLPERYWFEDTISAFILNALAKRTATVQEVIYHWRKNMGSISFTSIGQSKIVDTIYVTLQVLADYEKLGLPIGDDFRQALMAQLCINTKRVYSFGDRRIDYANFIISRELYRKYCPEKKKLTGRDKELEKALETNNFKRFMLACMLL